MSEEEHNSPEGQEGADENGSAFGLVCLSVFILTLIGALVALPFAGEKDPELLSRLIPLEWLAKVTGDFHPLTLHLPIGIVFLTFTMELFGWISFGRYKPKTGLALFLGVITGAFACVTGYVNFLLGGDSLEKWEDHMWGGIIFVGVLGLAYLAKLWGARNRTHGPVYGFLLIGAFGALGYGAHFGGENVHGTDPVKDLLVGLEIVPGEKDGDSDQEGGKQSSVIKSPEERLAYADVVVPILEGKCYDCHAEGKKKKGGLLMDSWEALLEGGDEAAALVPGDPEKSFMIEVIHLPEDDDYHMPPPKKTQLEAHEIELLDWWVASLPKSETHEDKTLKELNAPQNIIDAAAKLVTPEELAAMKAAEEAEKKSAEDAAAAKREKIEGSLNILKQDDLFKSSLMYVSQDSTDLEFTAVSLRKSLNDEGFLKLAPIAESLSSVKIGATSISEGALVTELPKMTNLTKLDLSQMKIGDGAMDAVAQLKELEWLNLYGTEVTDDGLLKLKGLTKLKKVYLWDSKATPDGAAALKKELPDLEAFFGAK